MSIMLAYYWDAATLSPRDFTMLKCSVPDRWYLPLRVIVKARINLPLLCGERAAR